MPAKSTRDTLIIIDGYSLLFRAFFATQYFSTSDGRPTNALFGFSNMVLSLLEKERPYGLVVVFDAPGKTFRDALYPEYKGHRQETDPALKDQLPKARDLCAALGLDFVEVVGFEADDLAGTLARRAGEQGLHALIVTGDKDQLQLVDDNTTVRMTKRGLSDVEDYTPANFHEHFPFPPSLIPDYKALRGDPSDNIPGVAGVGDKTASALLEQFGPVESILARLEEVAPKVRDKIAADPEVLTLGKKLTTIVTDMELDFQIKPYRVTPQTVESAKRLFTDLEFRSLMRRLDVVLPLFSSDPIEAIAEVVEAVPARTVTANSPEELFARFSGLPEVAIAMGEEGVAVAVGDEATLIPREMTGALDWLAHTGLALHDGRLVTAPLGFAVRFAFDAQLAAYVLAPGRGKYMLQDTYREFFGREMAPDPGSQAVALWALREPMKRRLAEEGTLSVYEQVDLPLLPILIEMERAGILVDARCLQAFSADVTKQIAALQTEIWDLAGEEFTIGSPKQLGYILFEKLGLAAGKKTKTGYSTDVDVLNMLAADNEIAAKVLNWRELTKLKSTYADSLPALVREDGRIHTTFNQTVAATGRLSSMDPNLQNIPVRTELGREIRRAFVAPPGKLLLSLDYSQIELRLLAHMCDDPVLVEAFAKGEDIHTATAASIFGVADEAVTSDQRRQAKMVNYAVLYGMSDFGLAGALGLGVSEARGIIQAYFDQFPSVKRFTETIVEEARMKGFTTTLTGRRRYFPDIHSANRNVRMGAERQAVNAPIQGSAADVIKIAMINLYKTNLMERVTMLLQVHDELVFECAEGDVGIAGDLAKVMAEPMKLKVPLVVDAKIGPNWRDMC